MQTMRLRTAMKISPAGQAFASPSKLQSRWLSADSSNGSSKKKQDAVIMRLRRKEEETKKYIATAERLEVLWPSVWEFMVCGLGWTVMDPRMGGISSRRTGF
eukprot:749767-Hanusia_phi.AAC.2